MVRFTGSGSSGFKGAGSARIDTGFVNAIRATRFSATEWRIITRVGGASQIYQVEWRLKTASTLPISASGPIWFIQGIYARDLTQLGKVQMSDSTDNSVLEYAWVIGPAGAPPIAFDFYGNGHGGETLSSPITFTLDGVDISALSIGASRDGLLLSVVENKNILLPRNADGTQNLSTQIGTGVTTHTFDASGMKITHTHTFSAGYEGYTCYAAMLPNNYANFNRVAVNGGAAYTPVGNNSSQFVGTQITTASAWHTTAHHFKYTMSLPSGGPAVPSDWSVAGPDYGFFVDDPARGKVYILLVNDTYPTRKPLSTLGVGGTITCEQQYVVEYR